MLKLVLIGGGGAIGALLRYGLSGWVQRWTDSAFPWGTFAVNVVGCFAIGFFGALLAGPYLREEWRLLFMVGILGSFTTFSTFGYETFELAGADQLRHAGANILLSNAVGLAAVWLGYRLTEHFSGG